MPVLPLQHSFSNTARCLWKFFDNKIDVAALHSLHGRFNVEQTQNKKNIHHNLILRRVSFQMNAW